MIITNTDGTETIFIDMCFYCNLNTAGEHESHCPLARKSNENTEEGKGIMSYVKGLKGKVDGILLLPFRNK